MLLSGSPRTNVSLPIAFYSSSIIAVLRVSDTKVGVGSSAHFCCVLGDLKICGVCGSLHVFLCLCVFAAYHTVSPVRLSWFRKSRCDVMF